MINIVHVDINCNDERRIMSIELKLKSLGNTLTIHQLIATVSSAFFKTTLLADEGGTLKTAINKKRKNVVDLTISFNKENNLKPNDIANFIDVLQEAIDVSEKSLF